MLTKTWLAINVSLWYSRYAMFITMIFKNKTVVICEKTQIPMSVLSSIVFENQ